MRKLIAGWKLREVRKSRGLTLQQVSAATGISVSYLSKVERDQANITVGYLKTLVDFYRAPLLTLMADRDLSNGVVVRKGEGPSIVVGGVQLELLLPQADGKMEPIIACHPPGTSSGRTYTHEGEEFNYVLKGELRYHLGDAHYDLREGDSIYHLSTVPHGWANLGSEPCYVLTVVTPPSFMF